MKKILLFPSLLSVILLFFASCHQGYVCSCMVKDTSQVIMTNYSITANNQSAANSQCAGVQAEHTTDTCRVEILKD